MIFTINSRVNEYFSCLSYFCSLVGFISFWKNSPSWRFSSLYHWNTYASCWDTSFILHLLQKESLLLKKNQWLHLFLLSICAVYLTNILELWGLKYLSAGKTCLLFSLSPFLTALFSYFEWGETLTKKKILGLILGFLGILPIIINSQNEAAHAEFLYVSLAELAVLGAIVCSVYGWVILRKLGNDLEMSIPLANGYSMCIGGMLALIQSYFTESWSPSPVTEWAPFLEGFFVLLIVSNLICYNLYGYLLKNSRPPLCHLLV